MQITRLVTLSIKFDESRVMAHLLPCSNIEILLGSVDTVELYHKKNILCFEDWKVTDASKVSHW